MSHELALYAAGLLTGGATAMGWLLRRFSYLHDLIELAERDRADARARVTEFE